MDLIPFSDEVVSSLATVAMYGRGAARVAREGRRRLGREERIVFVVGSPRSGTTFTAGALGSLPGFVDLGEVRPWRAAIPRLFGRGDDDVALPLRRILERVRKLGLANGLRGVEQTPETSFVLAAALQAYPDALAVHVIRDGRDVAASLLEKGWLNADQHGVPGYDASDDFWVEPDRVDEFERVSDATRAAWAWRRHVLAAFAVPERTVQLRYEQLVLDPRAAATALAPRLDVDADLLAHSFGAAHSSSLGRWRRDLSPEQVSDVEDEAGDLLAALGYVAG